MMEPRRILIWDTTSDLPIFKFRKKIILPPVKFTIPLLLMSVAAITWEERSKSFPILRTKSRGVFEIVLSTPIFLSRKLGEPWEILNHFPFWRRFVNSKGILEGKMFFIFT